MENQKKYKMTDDVFITPEGRKLRRIQALITFNGVRAGDLGGYIQSEANLSHDGNAWVYDYAMVYGNARVYENAQIHDQAVICGNARVHGSATVEGDCKVFDNAEIFENAKAYCRSYIHDNARLYGESTARGFTFVFGNAQIRGRAVVMGEAGVYGDAIVEGFAHVGDQAILCANAQVAKDDDYIYINALGSPYESTFFRCQDGKLRAAYDDFFGDIQDYRNRIKLFRCLDSEKKKAKLIADFAEQLLSGDSGTD